jgi:hypothetical protein
MKKITSFIICVCLCIIGIATASDKIVSIQISLSESQGELSVNFSNNSSAPHEMINPNYSIHVELWDGDLGFRVYPLRYMKLVRRGGFSPVEKIQLVAGQRIKFKFNLMDFGSSNEDVSKSYLERIDKAQSMRAGYKLIVKAYATDKQANQTGLVLSNELIIGVGQ